MKLNPTDFDKVFLGELIEAGVLVFWTDPENGDYLSLKPTARREILQLPPPVGFYYQDFKGLSKMTKRRPHEWVLENAPEMGRRDPASTEASFSIKEGEKVE